MPIGDVAGKALQPVARSVADGVAGAASRAEAALPRLASDSVRVARQAAAAAEPSFLDRVGSFFNGLGIVAKAGADSVGNLVKGKHNWNEFRFFN